MKRARVLVVIGHLGRGGSERFVYEILRAIDRSRFDVHVLTAPRFFRRDYYEPLIEKLGIPIHHRLPLLLEYARHRLPALMSFRRIRTSVEWLQRFAAFLTLRDFLNGFDVLDVVQIENYLLMEPLVPDNDRMLIHIMAAGFQYPEGKEPYLECRTDRRYRFAIFDDTHVADFAASPCRNAEIFSFPLPANFDDTVDLSSYARIEPPYTIGVFIRLSHERPVDGILRAFATLSRSVDANLMWFGRGDPGILEPAMSELGIANRVSFHAPADIGETLRSGRLSFVFSTGNRAALGYAGIDVASFGFPMLVWSQTEYPHEAILNASNGAIHAHHDPEALAADALKLLSSPDEFRRLGRALRRYVLAIYDISRHIMDLETKFDEIAGRANPKNPKHVP